MGDEPKIRLRWKMPRPPQKSAGRSMSREHPKRAGQIFVATDSTTTPARSSRPYCQHFGGVGTTTVVVVM
jgi:hypothetical protein